jgi:hypothetical protein
MVVVVLAKLCVVSDCDELLELTICGKEAVVDEDEML